MSGGCLSVRRVSRFRTRPGPAHRGADIYNRRVPTRTKPSRAKKPPAHDAAHHHLPAGWTTAAQLLAGATIPVRMRVTVKLYADSAEQPAPRAPCAGAMPPSVEPRLRQHTPRLLAWAKDPANARQLLLDPTVAARKAGVELSAPATELLRSQGVADARTSVLPAGVELVALEVSASASPRPDVRIPPPPPRVKPKPRSTAKRAVAKGKRTAKRKGGRS